MSTDDQNGTKAPNGATGGAFVVIDHDKLGPDGFKLIGGIEALNAAEATIKKIRERSTVVQERVFLQEVADLLKQFAGEHQRRLVVLAMQTGAGTVRDAPQGGKAN